MSVHTQISNAVAVDPPRYLLKRRHIVRFAPQRVVVQHGTNDRIVNHPDFAGVGFLGIWNFFFAQAPLKQNIARDRIPQLYGRYQIAAYVVKVYASDIFHSAGVVIQPVEAANTEVGQDRAHRIFIVALHADHVFDVFACEVMNLDDRHGLYVVAPRCPVKFERVYAFPLVAYNLDYAQTTVHVLHGFAFAGDRAFEDRVRERGDVVGKLKHCFGEPALYELVLHLLLHAIDAFVSFVLHRTHGSFFHAAGQLLEVGLCGLFPALGVVLHEVLLHQGLHRSLNVWRNFRNRCR